MKEKMIALLGQPNCGKSSVFNGLTGSHQHVGNWPGKTVEHKEGIFRFGGETYWVVDLPGSYSLSAGTDEEVITTEYLRSGEADLVAILVDSSQLERSPLYGSGFCWHKNSGSADPEYDGCCRAERNRDSYRDTSGKAWDSCDRIRGC